MHRIFKKKVMFDYNNIIVSKIPSNIRDHIKNENLIDNMKNPKVFEYMFDVYEQYIDINGEHDDWNCSKCRDFVYQEWLKLKPYVHNNIKESNKS